MQTPYLWVLDFVTSATKLFTAAVFVVFLLLLLLFNLMYVT